jgi:hypothetical protein
MHSGPESVRRSTDLFGGGDFSGEGAQFCALLFIQTQGLFFSRFAHDADNFKLIIHNEVPADASFVHRSDLRVIFLHDEAKELQLVDAKDFCKRRHLVDRQLGLSLLQHGDEVGLVIADSFGDFSLLELGVLDGLGEKVFDRDVLGNIHVLLPR